MTSTAMLTRTSTKAVSHRDAGYRGRCRLRCSSPPATRSVHARRWLRTSRSRVGWACPARSVARAGRDPSDRQLNDDHRDREDESRQAAPSTLPTVREDGRWPQSGPPTTTLRQRLVVENAIQGDRAERDGGAHEDAQHGNEPETSPEMDEELRELHAEASRRSYPGQGQAPTGIAGTRWGLTMPESPPVAILGIDVGGTFTDAVLLDGGRRARPRRCRPRARQEESVVAAARGGRRAASVERFTHGTTVATNALLERKRRAHGVRRDRRLRAPAAPAAPGPRAPLPALRAPPGAARPARALLRRRERIGPGRRPRAARPRRRCPTVDAEAVAVCLLFAFRDPAHEQAVAAGAAPAASRTRTSSPRTRSRPSSASTSAPRRPRPTPTSAPVVARYLRALADACRGGRAAGAARDALVRRRRLARGGGRAPGVRRSSPARPAGVVGAARVARLRRRSRTRSRSTWAARRPTSA